MAKNSIEVIIKAVDQVTKPLKNIGGNFDKSFAGFKKGFKDAKKDSKEFTEGLGGGLARLTNPLVLATGAVVGLGLAISSAIDEGRKFQKAMAEVSTLVDTSKVNMEELGEKTLEMSKRLGAPAVQLAAGLYQTISAGVTDAAEAMSVLEVSTKAAVAGIAASESSVKAITSVINAYGLEASDAEAVSDLFFKTIEKGVTKFPELAESIGTVIAPAASLGIKLGDLFSALATLTKGGINTRVATTALRATFLSILKPSDEAKKTAQDLTLAWDAQTLKTKGLIPFLNDMKKATGGNTELMSKLIPEARALNAVLALTGDQFETLTDIQKDMQGSLGATDTAFKKMENTYDFQAKKLTALATVTKINLFTKFEPVLAGFIKGIRVAINLAVGSLKVLVNSTTAIMARFTQGILGPVALLSAKVTDFFGITKGAAADWAITIKASGLLANAMAESTAKAFDGTFTAFTEGTKAVDKLASTQNDLANRMSSANERTKTGNVILKDNISLTKSAEKAIARFITTAGKAGKTRIELLEEEKERLDTLIVASVAGENERSQKFKDATKKREQLNDAFYALSDALLEKDFIKDEKIQDAKTKKQKQELKRREKAAKKASDAFIVLADDLHKTETEKAEDKLDRDFEILLEQVEQTDATTDELEQIWDAYYQRLDSLGEKHKTKNSLLWKSVKTTTEGAFAVMEGAGNSMARAFVMGGDMGKAAYQGMANTLTSLAQTDISNALKSVMDPLINSIAASLGLGAAASGGHGAVKGGAPFSIAQTAFFLGSAGVKLVAARALAQKAFPKKEGGFVFGGTGLINAGTTGTADDVLIRQAPNVNVFGSKGEFIVNADQTRKFLPVLNQMNKRGTQPRDVGFGLGGFLGDVGDFISDATSDVLGGGGDFLSDFVSGGGDFLFGGGIFDFLADVDGWLFRGGIPQTLNDILFGLAPAGVETTKGFGEGVGNLVESIPSIPEIMEFVRNNVLKQLSNWFKNAFNLEAWFAKFIETTGETLNTADGFVNNITQPMEKFFLNKMRFISAGTTLSNIPALAAGPQAVLLQIIKELLEEQGQEFVVKQGMDKIVRPAFITALDPLFDAKGRLDNFLGDKSGLASVALAGGTLASMVHGAAKAGPIGAAIEGSTTLGTNITSVFAAKGVSNAAGFADGGLLKIPALANGGIVNKPTLALIGEDGPEVVIPLSDLNLDISDISEFSASGLIDAFSGKIAELNAFINALEKGEENIRSGFSKLEQTERGVLEIKRLEAAFALQDEKKKTTRESIKNLQAQITFLENRKKEEEKLQKEIEAGKDLLTFREKEDLTAKKQEKERIGIERQLKEKELGARRSDIENLKKRIDEIKRNLRNFDSKTQPPELLQQFKTELQTTEARRDAARSRKAELEQILSSIPALANGGIVNKPTVALIGEAGPEAVIPLSNQSKQNGDVTIIIKNIEMFPNITASDTLLSMPRSQLKQFARKNLFVVFEDLAREGVFPRV